MYDEIEARQLCIRALNQFMQAESISDQEKTDANKVLVQLKGGKGPSHLRGQLLCSALASYLQSIKSIESFMIADPQFRGFEGSNPLLVTLNKEIGLTLDAKGQLCHDDVPKRQSRIDW